MVSTRFSRKLKVALVLFAMVGLLAVVGIRAYQRNGEGQGEKNESTEKLSAVKMDSKTPPETKEPDEIVSEVAIVSKTVKIGMEHEDLRAILGKPDQTEPCGFGGQPAFRLNYYRGGCYYIFTFASRDDAKVLLRHIDVNGGY